VNFLFSTRSGGNLIWELSCEISLQVKSCFTSKLSILCYETIPREIITYVIVFNWREKLNKTMLAMAALLFIAPAAVMAHQHDHEMTEELNSSPAAQEYTQGMRGMHDDMAHALNETDADKAFAKGMIAHHKGAIAMAETELKYGKDPVMRDLAEEVIKAQTAEIAHMEGWLSK
jgi:hypothetical protein